ncbi:MAG: hypothetical protein ACLUJG_11100 [Lawsonibacter sp.]
MICILLLLAMGITASSIGLNRTIEAAADGQAPLTSPSRTRTPTTWVAWTLMPC